MVLRVQRDLKERVLTLPHAHDPAQVEHGAAVTVVQGHGLAAGHQARQLAQPALVRAHRWRNVSYSPQVNNPRIDSRLAGRSIASKCPIR